VLCNEEDVVGGAGVIIDVSALSELREVGLCRYEGWLVVKTL